MKISIKNLLLKFVFALCGLLLLPLILITLPILAFITLLLRPFRVAKYKKSRFYREYGEKFDYQIYHSEWFKIYEIVQSLALPIACLPIREEDGKIVDLLFLYSGTLLLPFPDEIEYDETAGEWTVVDFDEEADEIKTIPLSEHLAAEMAETQAIFSDLPPIQRTILLAREENLSTADVQRARETEQFLVYNSKNLAEVLQTYISAN